MKLLEASSIADGLLGPVKSLQKCNLDQGPMNLWSWWLCLPWWRCPCCQRFLTNFGVNFFSNAAAIDMK